MAEQHTQKKNELRVYRSEIKYLIGMAEFETLRRLLAAVMQPDPYMLSPDGYLIRSLYFDSLTDQDYFDKLDGVENRKKIRLRIYDLQTDVCKLEIKNRFNNYNLKESLTVSRADAEALIEGNTGALLQYDTPIAEKAYRIMHVAHYSPRVIVEYDREAYVLPAHDVRITFDKNVRAAFSPKLFEPFNAMTPLCEAQTMILEVKFNQFLPMYLQDILSCSKGQMLSVSKYCLAREIFE